MHFYWPMFFIIINGMCACLCVFVCICVLVRACVCVCVCGSFMGSREFHEGVPHRLASTDCVEVSNSPPPPSSSDSMTSVGCGWDVDGMGMWTGCRRDGRRSNGAGAGPVLL